MTTGIGQFQGWLGRPMRWNTVVDQQTKPHYLKLDDLGFLQSDLWKLTEVEASGDVGRALAFRDNVLAYLMRLYGVSYDGNHQGTIQGSAKAASSAEELIRVIAGPFEAYTQAVVVPSQRLSSFLIPGWRDANRELSRLQIEFADDVGIDGRIPERGANADIRVEQFGYYPKNRDSWPTFMLPARITIR